MTEADAVEHARRLFLDEGHAHGCAEAAYVALATAYGLDGAGDSAPAMALNGGVAYGGGTCGAITGAALAVGRLVADRIDDHREAKRVAREIVAGVMDEFAREHGAVECRALIGYDLRAPGQHDAFIASGLWRDRCMRQIEETVGRLAPLAGDDAWVEALREIDEAPP